MNKFFWYLLVVWVLLSSCSKKLSLFNTDPNQFNLNNVEYEYLSIKSKLRYDDQDKKHKGTANIRIKHDSIVWFSITPGMGIEAARGVIRKDTLLIVDRINKQYTVEAVDKLTEKIKIEMDLPMLESILIGNLIWPVMEEDDITRSKGFYVIPKEYETLKVKSYIGAHSKKLERITASSDSSSSTLNIKYSEFMKVDEKVIPKKIDIQIKYSTGPGEPQKISNITIEHAKVEIDKELKFSFSIPKKYMRVRQN